MHRQFCKAAFVLEFVLPFLFFQTGCENDVGLNEPGVIRPPTPVPPTYFDHLAWHPAGEWIAAEHADSLDTDNNSKLDTYFSGIWLVHAETGETFPLLNGFILPAWSPDGKKLAVVRQAQIYTITVPSLKPVRVDSNSLRQVTFEGNNFYPAWSPDGQQLAYDSNLNDPVGAHVIWTMMIDGSDKKDVSEHRVGEWRMPSWSPNGRYIVHQRYYAGVNEPEIVVMDMRGQNAVRLTFDDRNDAHPKYSPDGRKIAFYSRPRIEGTPALWMINNDGTGLRKVSPDYAWRFDWSLDGSKLVFLYLNFRNPTSGSGELWLINTDGTGLRRLTYFRGNSFLTKRKEGIDMNEK